MKKSRDDIGKNVLLNTWKYISYRSNHLVHEFVAKIVLAKSVLALVELTVPSSNQDTDDHLTTSNDLYRKYMILYIYSNK